MAAAAAAAAAGAAAAAAALNDNDENVVDGADPRADASFSDRIIATGRHPDFNPRAQLGDFCHDGEDLAFKKTKLPSGEEKSSYAELGAAITIPARRNDIAASFANQDAILALEDTLLTQNGSARGDTILQHMRKPDAPHPDTYKIGSYPVDELYLLTEPGGPMHRARAIIQDSCPFNAFVSKKTGQPLIGAGINGGTLELNNSIIKQLDGADAPSENSINRNMRITTEPNNFTVHMFLPGYRFRYLKVDDTTLQIHIIKLIGAAWTPICEVTCKAGISVNAVCQAAGVPPPRGTGKVKNALRVSWLEAARPEDREPALLLYIKTLTDWAQVYHGAKLWYDYHILEPVLSFDTFCKEAAVWLDTPMFLLASPKGFVDVMVCDPDVLEISESDMAKIRGKFVEAKGNPTTNIILNAIHDTAVRELRNIPYLLTKSNVYCYFMAREIDTIIRDITQRRDALIADIVTYPDDINPAKGAAEVKKFYQKYFSLTTKSIYEYMVDLVQPIVKLTDKYESINNRLTSAFSTWKQVTDSLIHQDEGKGAAQDDADATASALVARMIGIMQSAGAAATSQTNGAWFSYLQLGGGAMGKTRPQRIMKMYQQLPADIGEHFVTHCAAHYKLDSAGIPKVGFARILGAAANGIEQKRETYTIVSPVNPVISEGARLAARQPAEGGPIVVPLLGQLNIVAAATGTRVTDNRIDHDNYSMSSEKYFKVLDARLLSILQIVQTIAEQGVEALTPPAAAAGAGAGAPAPPPPEKLALQIAALAAIDAATAPAPAPAAAAAAVGGAGGPAAPPAPAQPTSIFDSPELNTVKEVYDATCAQDAVDRLTSVSDGTDEFTDVAHPYTEKVSTSFVGLPLATFRTAVSATKHAIGWVNSMFGGIFCFRWRAGVAGGAGGAAPVELIAGHKNAIQVGGARKDGELQYCFKFYPNAPVAYIDDRGAKRPKTLMHAVIDRMQTIFFEWNIAEVDDVPNGADIDRFAGYDFAKVDSRDRFIDNIMKILKILYHDAVDSDMDIFYVADLKNLLILYRLYRDGDLSAGEFLKQLACNLFFSDNISEVFEREFAWRMEIKEICLQMIFWIQNPHLAVADPRLAAAKTAMSAATAGGGTFSEAGRSGDFGGGGGGGGFGGGGGGSGAAASAAAGSNGVNDALTTLAKVAANAEKARGGYATLRAAQEAALVRRRDAAAEAAAAMPYDSATPRRPGGGGGGGGDDDDLTLEYGSAGGAGGSPPATQPILEEITGDEEDAGAEGEDEEADTNDEDFTNEDEEAYDPLAALAAVAGITDDAIRRVTAAGDARKAAAGAALASAGAAAAAAHAKVSAAVLSERVGALRAAINARVGAAAAAEQRRLAAMAAAEQRLLAAKAARDRAALAGSGSDNRRNGEGGGFGGAASPPLGRPAFGPSGSSGSGSAAGLLGAGGGFGGAASPPLGRPAFGPSGSGGGSAAGLLGAGGGFGGGSAGSGLAAAAFSGAGGSPAASRRSSASAGAEGFPSRNPSGSEIGGGSGLTSAQLAAALSGFGAGGFGFGGSGGSGSAAAAPSRAPSGGGGVGSGGSALPDAPPVLKRKYSNLGSSGSGGGGAGPSRVSSNSSSRSAAAAAAAAGSGGGGGAGPKGPSAAAAVEPAAKRSRSGNLPAGSASSGGGTPIDEVPPTPAELAAAAAAAAAAAGSGGGGGGGSPINTSEGGYRKPRRRSRKRSKHSSRRLTRRFG